MTKITWTKKELKEFDAITWQISSLNQMDRINGRLDMQKFMAEHGQEKCSTMFEHLKQLEKRQGNG